MDDEAEQRIRRVARESFSRSGGPGGQNVNKVSTQVTLHVPLLELGLQEETLERVRERLGARVSGEGELVVHCSETRSQVRNREIAIERAIALIDAAMQTRRRRRPTRPSAASREARLSAKRRNAERKRDRNPPTDP